MTSSPAAGTPVLEVVADLQRRVDRLQGRPEGEPLPTHPGLSGLLEVRPGGVYGVDTASLALLMLAGPSAQGSWCGIVGVRDLGVEAAVGMGVDPARTIVVPDPGDAWLEVTAALADVLAMVVVRPPSQGEAAANGPGRRSPVTARDASRLAARLRTRGSVLVPWGEWPRCDARLSLGDVRWGGVEQGHGHLRSRQATVSVRRGDAPSRSRPLWLPAADLTVRPVQDVHPVSVGESLLRGAG